jgi:hypothetical protein
MAKKRAPAQDLGRPSEHRVDRTRSGSAVDHEADLGNQAAQHDIAAQVSSSISSEVLCETALPAVEQALLAVQLSPRSVSLTERMVEVLGKSRLSEERQNALMSRLQEDQATSDLIHNALERAFGSDTPQIREALWATLDTSWNVLANSSVGSSELSEALTNGRESDGVGERANRLIGDIAAAVANQTMLEQLPAEQVSSSVQEFCRSIALLFYWEEEEEEEEAGWDLSEREI